MLRNCPRALRPCYARPPTLSRLMTPVTARVARPATRFLSTAANVAPDVTDAEWEMAFLAATEDVSGARSHADSAAAMRALVRSGLLRNTDLRDRPERCAG
jgi:hypothetical protein